MSRKAASADVGGSNGQMGPSRCRDGGPRKLRRIWFKAACSLVSHSQMITLSQPKTVSCTKDTTLKELARRYNGGTIFRQNA